MEVDIQSLLDKAKSCAERLDRFTLLDKRIREDFRRYLDTKKAIIPIDIRRCFFALWVVDAKDALEANAFSDLEDFCETVAKKAATIENARETGHVNILLPICEKIKSIVDSHYEEVCKSQTKVVIERTNGDKKGIELDALGRMSLPLSIRIENKYGRLAPNLCHLQIAINGEMCFKRDEIGCGALCEETACIPVTEENWNSGELDCNFRICFDTHGRHEEQTGKISVPIQCRLDDSILPLFGEKEAVGESFAGREDKLAKVRAYFSAAKSNSGFLVTGQRRSGKSSFLKQVGETLGDAGYVHVRISLYGDHASDKDDGANTPFHRIFGKIEKCLRLGSGESASDDDRLARIAEVMRNDARTYVVSIDEYQNLYDGYFSAEDEHRSAVDKVAEHLRWLMTQGCCHLLVAAQDYIGEYRNLMNVFAPLTPLRMMYFDEHEIRELAAKLDPPNMGFRRLDDSAVHWLYTFTGGHPFFAQKICAYLAGVFNAQPEDGNGYRLSLSDYLEVERKFLDVDSVTDPVLQYADFESFFELRLFEKDANGNSKLLPDSKLHEFYFSMAKDVCPSWYDKRLPWVLTLKDRGIILKASGNLGYRLRAVIFSKWLAARDIEDCPVEKFLSDRGR